MMERTFFIIKPEAFSNRDEIKLFIESHSNLKVVEAKTLILTKRDVKTLYSDDIGTDLLFATQRHLAGKKVMVGIVQGENAIDEFTRVCGKYPDGNLCEENTIRKIFGKKKVIKYGAVTYFLNAIHKSSRKEAETSVQWYYDRGRSF